MPNIPLSDIVFDPNIYPREKWNTSTVDTYVDVIKSGQAFPPLILEEGTNLLLDGVHRWKAYQKYQEKYQEHLEEREEKAQLKQEGKAIVETPDFWAVPLPEVNVDFHVIPEVKSYQRNGESEEDFVKKTNALKKLYAAGLSAKHGDRMKASDRKSVAREIYENHPDFTLATLAKYLSVSIGTSHNYVSDILARQKEAQKMIALRLNLLGWTEREIAEKIGITHAGVQKFWQLFSDLKKVAKNLLNEGHPHMEVAERYNMPLQLVWAIDLECREDKTRMERLNMSVMPYDVWTFGKCHDLFGNQHPGRIPGQLIAHVLYFFTEPGDMVIDPMSGSGTTQDVCLAMGRKCYAYDIDTRHERSDVIVHNIHTDGWHHRVKKANLIFWDPPYFEKMDKSNIGGDGYIEGSISQLPRGQYLEFFAKALSEAATTVKPGTKLAFLMSDWDDATGEREGVFLWDYADIILKAGWKLKRHIQVPLSTQQVHPDIVNKFRKSRRLARLERYLLIAERG